MYLVTIQQGSTNSIVVTKYLITLPADIGLPSMYISFYISKLIHSHLTLPLHAYILLHVYRFKSRHVVPILHILHLFTFLHMCMQKNVSHPVAFLSLSFPFFVFPMYVRMYICRYISLLHLFLLFNLLSCSIEI
jgi:hypothetical protein